MAALGVVFVGHAAAWIAIRVCETNRPPLDIKRTRPGVRLAVTFVGISGHVVGTPSVTFTGTSVTMPEWPQTAA